MYLNVHFLIQSNHRNGDGDGNQDGRPKCDGGEGGGKVEVEEEEEKRDIMTKKADQYDDFKT